MQNVLSSLDGKDSDIEEKLFPKQKFSPSRYLASSASKHLCNSSQLHKAKPGCELTVGSVCPICLEKMCQSDTQNLQLPCGHYFHHTCVRKWLHDWGTCPVCREHISKAVQHLLLLVQKNRHKRVQRQKKRQHGISVETSENKNYKLTDMSPVDPLPDVKCESSGPTNRSSHILHRSRARNLHKRNGKFENCKNRRNGPFKASYQSRVKSRAIAAVADNTSSSLMYGTADSYSVSTTKTTTQTKTSRDVDSIDMSNKKEDNAQACACVETSEPLQCLIESQQEDNISNSRKSNLSHQIPSSSTRLTITHNNVEVNDNIITDGKQGHPMESHLLLKVVRDLRTETQREAVLNAKRVQETRKIRLELRQQLAVLRQQIGQTAYP